MIERRILSGLAADKVSGHLELLLGRERFVHSLFGCCPGDSACEEITNQRRLSARMRLYPRPHKPFGEALIIQQIPRLELFDNLIDLFVRIAARAEFVLELSRGVVAR